MCLIFGMPCLLWRWFEARFLCLSRQVTPGVPENPGHLRRALDSGPEARDKVAMNLLQPIDRSFSVKGLRLHLLDWGGEGRTPLLLLHGFTGHAHAWDTLAIALQPHFHVYALDQRGHGDSDPATVYGPIAAFDDLDGVVDQLGLAPTIMVGLSMGGRNAIYFTAKRPYGVGKLVIRHIGPEISKRASEAPPGP